jgi:hypothetical protein
MKRILLVAVGSSALALAAPAVASAHHHGRHHHKRHAARARVLDFRATALSVAATPGAPASDETAGTVSSFKEGVLTITLTNGTPVSGRVTEETEIQCATAMPSSTGDDGGDEGGSGEGDQGSATDDQSGVSSSHDAHAASNGGDGEGEPESADDEQQSCTTTALTPGAAVREAELSIGSSGAVWDHVDLI